MKIYLLNGADSGLSFELDKDTVKLGRELDNDVSFTTGGVSRYHAELQRTDKGVWLVSDLESTNGTKVNGRLIQRPHVLEEGDVISLGDQNIRFGEKKDLARDVAEVIRSSSELEGSSPKVIFHTTPPSNTGEGPVTPVISIKPADPTVVMTEKTSVPEPEKTDLSIFENKNLNLFQKKKKTDSGHKDGEEKKPRRLSSTLLFYTSIVALIACFAAGFHYFNRELDKPKGNDSDKAKVKPPFMLSYVKESIEGNNIFRFSLDINAGNAIFCVDDLKSKRHYVKNVGQIELQYLESLQKDIRNTDFFKLDSEYIGAPSQAGTSERRLLIACDSKMNEVLVKDTYAPNSFEEITQSIDAFAAHYSLYTIAMTVEEIMKIARQDFNNAEDLFRNRDANPTNLLKSIGLYKLVVENLDPFQPKPEIWDRARKREQEAEAIRKKMEDDLNFEFIRCVKLKDYEGAKKVVDDIIEILPRDSAGYGKAIEKKLELERRIRAQRKR